MEVIWDQLASSELVMRHKSDIKIYNEFRDHLQLIQFLMAFIDDYELVRAVLLHQDPLPTLDEALPQLKLEETRLGLFHPKSDMAFTVTDKRGKICRYCTRNF